MLTIAIYIWLAALLESLLHWAMREPQLESPS
jgi:hypothetical protein